MKRFLLVGYPIIEFCTALTFIIWIGFGWTFLIYVAGFPIGWLLLKSAGRSTVELANSQRTPTKSVTFRFIAGVLFFIPGFWSDVLALLCLVPFIQDRIAAPFAFLTTPSGGVNWRMSSWSGGEVVEGVVIHEHDDPNTQRFLGTAD